MTKTEIFVPHQTTTQLFVTRTSYLKYQNNILSTKFRIRPKIIQHYKNMLCCSVCTVMCTYCFANQTRPLTILLYF